MQLNEIGQQLRAYRLESGLRAEEIAARLGVSRAALYRYEKGEVIKLDTVQRLAELLKISPLSLLGFGVEYYSRAVGFFERLRQIEESADQILQVGLPYSFLVASDTLDEAVSRFMMQAVAGAATADQDAALAMTTQVLSLLAARRQAYRVRRPGIIAILPEAQVRRLLEDGICPGLKLDEAGRRHCRAIARAEVQNIAHSLETEPMGLQFSLLGGTPPSTSCVLLRQRDRASLAINPFRADVPYDVPSGIAMVTSAPEAISTHQRVIEAMWHDSVKGIAAAQRLRALLAEHDAG
ncbi:MAG: helix-turn-helix transcriptional regulator [Gluconacetobacter diazotrophicus]|nr:helix-turn-helix transcriptional regulator [Gluconacetobacter diazotrophicus]